MVVDQVTGGRNSQSPFDANPVDGKFTTDDYVTFSDGCKAPESGIAIVGTMPGFIVASDNDHALIHQFNGKSPRRTQPRHGSEGRRTWRQLR